MPLNYWINLLMNVAAVAPLAAGAPAFAETTIPMVRIAEIEIFPEHLDAYKAILAEEQAASVRLEPGVLMLHSVSLTEQPTQIRLLEVYADRSAYEAHLKAPHFIHYKTATENMVKSLKLLESEPILLSAKPEATAIGPGTTVQRASK